MLSKPLEVRINKQQLDNAEDEFRRYGDGNNCKSICIMVRETCKRYEGYDPGWLEYSNLRIKRLRDVPAAAKPAKRSIKKTP